MKNINIEVNLKDAKTLNEEIRKFIWKSQNRHVYTHRENERIGYIVYKG